MKQINKDLKDFIKNVKMDINRTKTTNMPCTPCNLNNSICGLGSNFLTKKSVWPWLFVALTIYSEYFVDDEFFNNNDENIENLINKIEIYIGGLNVKKQNSIKKLNK